MVCDGCSQPEPQPKKVANWQVWYDDKSIHRSQTTAWSDLPKDGVLVVMLYFSDGTRRVMSGADYYFQQADIFGCSTNETEEEVRRRYSGAEIIRGKWTDDATMDWVNKQLME